MSHRRIALHVRHQVAHTGAKFFMFRIADILSGLGYVFYPEFPCFNKGKRDGAKYVLLFFGFQFFKSEFPFGGINNVEFQLGNQSWRFQADVKEPLEAKMRLRA